MVKLRNSEEQNLTALSLSTNKMLFILEFLAQSRLPAKLQEISTQIDMPQPSVLRYLNSLIMNGYVYKEEDTSRYGLTWKLLRIGNQLDTPQNMRNIVSPFINALSRKFNVGTCLVKKQDFHVIYVEIIDKPGYKHSLQMAGNKPALYSTGSGKLILSGLQDWQIDDILSKIEQEIELKQRVFDDLSLIRNRGFSIDDEEIERNYRCVSVPLYDFTDTITSSLCVFDSIKNLPIERINDYIIPVMKDMAKTISTRMGSSLSC